MSLVPRVVAMPSDTGSPKQQQDEVLGPAIMVMGGWESCATDQNGEDTPFGESLVIASTTELIRQLWEEARNESAKPVWFASCFNAWGSYYYTDSWTQHQIRSGTPPEYSSFHDFMNRAQAEGRQTVIIGHSHGGWLAAQTVANYGEKLVNGLLVTIDPISFEYCDPENFARFIIGIGLPIGNPTQELEPCQRAPEDIDENARTAIDRIVSHQNWLHYFQQNFWPLRSGHFEGANTPRVSRDLSPFYDPINGSMPTWNAHIRIAEHSGIYVKARLAD